MKIQDIYNLILESSVGRFSGAGIIFFNGQEVLMLKKPNNRWVFPGGKPIQGETPIETAKRETKEEVGRVEGQSIKELKFENDDRTFHSFIFKIDNTFEPTISKEHTDYKWINFKKIRVLRLHRNVICNIKNVINELKLLQVELF